MAARVSAPRKVAIIGLGKLGAPMAAAVASRGIQVIGADLDPSKVEAINRGEGLLDPTRLSDSLALQVRQVERGTVRSYRLYDANKFHLAVSDAASRARFVEHIPDALILRFSGQGNEAELVINLDVFEMLDRLNHGYRPSLEEEQGYYLSLAVFKNVLSAAPYQEVILTATGHEFYAVAREGDGRLSMSLFEAPEEAAADAHPG